MPQGRPERQKPEPSWSINIGPPLSGLFAFLTTGPRSYWWSVGRLALVIDTKVHFQKLPSGIERLRVAF